MKHIQTIMLASAFAFAATAAFAQSLEGTAHTFFTTAPGVSNFSHNMKLPLRAGDSLASVAPTAPLKINKQHTTGASDKANAH